MHSILQHLRAKRGRARRLYESLARSAVLVTVVTFALACGEVGLAPGGGGGGGGSETASVSVFVTDAPSDDFVAVNLTVTEITLLGGPSGPVTIFEGLETFDLLALRDVSELFAMNDAVPAGHYAKIRMTLANDGLELVVDDGNGGEELHYPGLPGNNKLDLIPRPGLVLGGGESIGIEIDVDVEKSIHVHQNGNGEYKFRPVVFVRVIRDLLDSRLVRLNGYVFDIDLDSRSFQLCRLRRPVAWLHDVRKHGPHPNSADFRAELAGSGASDLEAEIEIESMDRWHPWRRCIEVNLTETASIFDEDGTPIRLGDVMERERATVVGRIHPTRERKLEMFASLVLIGPPGSFEHRKGIVATELDEEGLFVLDLASGNGDLNVQVFPTTKIFERGGMALDPDAIQPDVRAGVTGVIVFSSEDPAVMNAAILILDLDDTEPVPLRGEITEINLKPREDECHISLDIGGPEAGVRVAERTVIFLIDPTLSESMIGELEDLEVGDIADVYGRSVDGDGCFNARVIVAFQQE